MNLRDLERARRAAIEALAASLRASARGGAGGVRLTAGMTTSARALCRIARPRAWR
jgi:hypothetical protein